MKSTLKIIALAGAFAALTALAMPTTSDAAGSEKHLKYRNGMMWSLANNLGGIFKNMKGEVDAKGAIPHHAMALEHLAKVVVHMFPAGSDGGRTKPEIWSNRADFEKAAKNLEAATMALAAVANSGDMAKIGGAAGGVGKACGGCHKPFRAEKK